MSRIRSAVRSRGVSISRKRSPSGFRSSERPGHIPSKAMATNTDAKMRIASATRRRQAGVGNRCADAPTRELEPSGRLRRATGRAAIVSRPVALFLFRAFPRDHGGPDHLHVAQPERTAWPDGHSRAKPTRSAPGLAGPSTLGRTREIGDVARSTAPWEVEVLAQEPFHHLNAQSDRGAIAGKPVVLVGELDVLEEITLPQLLHTFGPHL
jgi:hypothetical protein